MIEICQFNSVDRHNKQTQTSISGVLWVSSIQVVPTTGAQQKTATYTTDSNLPIYGQYLTLLRYLHVKLARLAFYPPIMLLKELK